MNNFCHFLLLYSSNSTQLISFLETEEDFKIYLEKENDALNSQALKLSIFLGRRSIK